MNTNLLKCKNFKELYSQITRKDYNYLAYYTLFLLIIIPLLEIPLYYLNNQFWYDFYPILMKFTGTTAVVFVLFMLAGYIVNKDLSIFNIIHTRPYLIFLGSFLLWCLISALLSNNHVYSLIGSFDRHEGFITYVYYGALFLCALTLTDNTLKKKLLTTFIGVSLILSVMMLFQYKWPLDSRIVKTTCSSVFFHFNHFGYYLTLTLTALFGLYIQEESSRRRILILCLIFFETFVLIVNDTFGCFLSTLICIGIMALLYRIHDGSFNKRFLHILAVFIFCNLFVCIIFHNTGFGMNIPDSFEQLFNDLGLISDNMVKDEDVSLDSIGTGRGIVWSRTAKLILQRPLFGYGPEMLTTQYMSMGDFVRSRPANEYLYYAAAMGIPALIFYLGILIDILVIQLKRIKQLSSITLLSATCVCGYLISAVFGNSTFYITPYFFMYLGFCSQHNDK